MTLLEILVQELPKRGGWPGDAVAISVSSNMRVYAHEKMPDRITDGVWTNEGENTFGRYGRVFFLGGQFDHREKPVTREQYEAALAATETEWNGEGMPPVGAQVEMSWAGDEWYKAVIVARGNEQIIYKMEGCEEFSGHKNNYQFRPIRSEADRKRDESVNEMLCVYRNSLGSTEDAFAEMYSAISAGKIPHLKIV